MRSFLSAAAVASLGLLLLLAGCDLGSVGPDPAQDAGFTAHSSSNAPERIPVCHYDADTDTFKLIHIAAPALAGHLGHGDGLPNGDVPGDPGATFSETCEIESGQQQFSCSFEVGEDTEGRPSATVELIVLDPLLLPLDDELDRVVFETWGETLIFETQTIVRIHDDDAEEVWIGARGSVSKKQEPPEPVELELRLENEQRETFTCGRFDF